MTLQEAFNKIWERAKDHTIAIAEGKCRYRTSDGHKCFIGILIPDKAYEPWMDSDEGAIAMNYPYSTLTWIAENILGIRDADDIERLGRLQKVHDHEPPDEWANSLRELATQFHLTVPK